MPVSHVSLALIAAMANRLCARFAPLPLRCKMQSLSVCVCVLQASTCWWEEGKVHSLAAVYFTTMLTHVVFANKYYIEKLAVIARKLDDFNFENKPSDARNYWPTLYCLPKRNKAYFLPSLLHSLLLR